jgi:hypothetical protein
MPSTLEGTSRPANEPKPTFTIAQDLPGTLSELGLRHDNDSEHIWDIQVLPTTEEVRSPRLEFLPREDSSEWHKSGLAGLIDRQFRLLREDSVGQLRDAAKHQLERLLDPTEAAPVNEKTARTNVYDEVAFEEGIFDEHAGLLFVFSFQQLRHLGGKSQRHREAWWEDSRRLAADSLICLLSSRGHVIFLVVNSPAFNPNAKNSAVHKRYSLSKHPERAFVIAKLTTDSPTDATTLLQGCTAADTFFSLVEFPGVLLPTFGPNVYRVPTHARQCACTPDARRSAPTHARHV